MFWAFENAYNFIYLIHYYTLVFSIASQNDLPWKVNQVHKTRIWICMILTQWTQYQQSTEIKIWNSQIFRRRTYKDKFYSWSLNNTDSNNTNLEKKRLFNWYKRVSHSTKFTKADSNNIIYQLPKLFSKALYSYAICIINSDTFNSYH